MCKDGYVVMLPNVNVWGDRIATMPPDPYAESSAQLFPAGTKLIQGERVWRYTLAGATGLNIAAPLQQAKAIHGEQDDDIVVGAAAAIGATAVELTSTANLAAAPLSTADGIAEGYLIVNDAAGEGQLYKIRSHDAFVSTDDSTINLYDALTIALTTSSQCGLIQNPYRNVIATEAVVSGICVGVPLIAVTAAYWFWSQTGGPAPVVVQAAINLGTEVVVGTTAAKADPAAAATTELCIGHAMTPGVADTESCIVFLTLDR
tara:strand:- start:2953 stop:3735 length:783 start_codon:yes stop_codon:yes gene_type:complete